MKGKFTEYDIYVAVAKFMAWKHRGVPYRFDYLAGAKINIGTARKNAVINQMRGWPDLFIAKPVGKWSGCFIEIKQAGYKPFKRDGSYKDQHAKEQAEMLQRLLSQNYCCYLAAGLENVVACIDDYLKGANKLNPLQIEFKRQ